MGGERFDKPSDKDVCVFLEDVTNPSCDHPQCQHLVGLVCDSLKGF